MKTIRLLQLGDIHFPDAKAAAQAVDNKDAGIPSNLVQAISFNGLEQVIREILRVREGANQPLGLLLCGDLTTGGDVAGYEDCLKYLAKSLEIDDASVWPDASLHAVPGNHDVDRSTTDPAATDLFAKFESAQAAWDRLRPNIFEPRDARTTSLSKSTFGIRVISLNSCLGCGEWRSRLLPTLPTELLEQIEPYFKEQQETPYGFFERLDTPAFHEKAIDKVNAEIKQTETHCACVVLSHHNILPQRTPRIDVYTEVINAGLIRGQLLALERPVIYCHGHIHSDPIEIVRGVNQSRAGMLVCISAPMLSDGFNILDIAFSQSCSPLGVTVRRYRDSGGGVFTWSPSVRIPFYSTAEAATQGIISDEMSETLRILAARPAPIMGFKECVDALRPKQKGTTEALLSEAEWLGYFRIRNRDQASEFWQIEKVIMHNVSD